VRVRLFAVAIGVAMLTAACVMPPDGGGPPPPGPVPTFGLLGRYSTGLGNASGEIAAVDGNLMVVTNGGNNSVDFVNVTNPKTPSLIQRIPLGAYGAGPNSAVITGSLVLVVVDALVPGGDGKLVAFDRAGGLIGTAVVGATPDNVAVSPDGTLAAIANEGEPTSYNQPDSIDPEGTVSVVDLTGLYPLAEDFVQAPPGSTGDPAVQAAVSTIGFTDFNAGGPREGDLPAGVRIFGPNASVAQDLEPEYITITGDNRTAFVTLQEANAVATVDLVDQVVDGIVALGTKDHSLPGNGLDASDRDNAINIANWPVKGLYQPDAIASFEKGGETYYLTANEGDAREYTGFAEEVRVGAGSVVLDPAVFPDAATLQQNANLGRLTITNTSPKNGSGQYTELQVFGGRSFSVRRADGTLVADTGDEFEQITAALLPENFNASNTSSTFDDRSDNKGPEPEGIATGNIDGNQLVFIGLERVGGIMVYDVTDPANPGFLQYLNTRDFGLPAAQTDAGPEGVSFVAPAESPTGKPLVVVAHEISGSVLLYGPIDPDGAGELTLLHNNDGESSLLGQATTVSGTPLDVAGVAAFASVTDRERRAARAQGNSVLNVYAGDAVLASSNLACSLPPVPPSTPVYDAVAQRQIDYDAHILGNHEFDFNPDFLQRFIEGFRTNGKLTQPFLSSNLDFSGEPGFDGLVDADGIITGVTTDDRVVAKSKIVNDRVTGGRFGVVGATTPSLPTISSPRNVTVTPDLPSTAAAVQAEVDRLRDDYGVERIIFVSHLQDLTNDKALVALLSGVDVAVAGGGDELLGNPSIPAGVQFLPNEPAPVGDYPTLQADADGTSVPIVTTSGTYRYAGRIDVVFDADGDVASVDSPDSYPRRVIPKTANSDLLGITDSVVPDAAITTSAVNPVAACTAAFNTPIVNTEVPLTTARGTNSFSAPGVRVSETNTGNTVTDGFLDAYDTYAPAAGLPARGPGNPVIAVQNGGGIRDNAGPVLPVGGVVPGAVTRKNTLDTLSFLSNVMTVVNDVSPTELEEILERSAASLPGAGGQFLQLAGIKVTYDVSEPAQVITAGVVTTAGNRVVSAELPDGTKLIDAGLPVAGAPSVRIITNSFTAAGGDNFTTLLNLPASDRVNLGATYEQAWVEYLQGLPAGAPGGLPSRPTITGTQYPVGGEGRITIQP
jgi:2',3'-cyclic-nucleotide 2'-phosphodiesterase (5'-nucleotidase family)